MRKFYRVFGNPTHEETKQLAKYEMFYFDEENGFARDAKTDMYIQYFDYVEAVYIRWNKWLDQFLIEHRIVTDEELANMKKERKENFKKAYDVLRNDLSLHEMLTFITELEARIGD